MAYFPEFALLATEDLNTETTLQMLQVMCSCKDPAGRHYLEFEDGDVINTPLPESLVNRILDSFDVNIETQLRWQTLDEMAT